ncbi:hypothetical protein D3C80_1718980 [compost metagenome]
MHDVVLQIDAFLRIADQLGARPERFTAVGQQAKTGAPFLRRDLRLDRAPESRFAGRHHRAVVMGQTRGGGTASEHQCDQHGGNEPEDGQRLVLAGCSSDLRNPPMVTTPRQSARLISVKPGSASVSKFPTIPPRMDQDRFSSNSSA